MSDQFFAVVEDVTVASQTAAGGTFTVAYPTGTDQRDFTTEPAIVNLWGAYHECAVSLGATEATLTWPAGSTTIPAGTVIPSVRLDKVGKRAAGEPITKSVLDEEIAAGYTTVKAGVAVGTASTGLNVGNAFEYVIDGVVYSKTSGTDVATLPASTDLGNSEKALYLLAIDAAGAYAVFESEPVAAGADIYWPKVPAGYAPVGGVKVETNGSATFNPGTDGLDKAGVTDTYYDFSRVPTAAF